MSRTATRWPRIPGMDGAGLGLACGVVATIVSSMGGLAEPLSAPVLLIAVVSAVTTVTGALLAGLQSWLLYASFDIGHTGELALNRPSFHSAVVLVGTAVIATAAGAAIRWIQQPAVVAIPQPRQNQDAVEVKLLWR